MSDNTRTAVLNAALELVSRPSENPPGDEQAVADWVVSRLESSSIPFDVETTTVEPNRPNVVARVGDPERGTVLFTGHMDVVPANAERWTSDPYNPDVRDERLIGRGTVDMKGALAAMIVATEQYYENTDKPGEVILAFVVDEEHTGHGTQTLVEEGIDADMAIVGEPTDMDVCTAIKGVSRYEATVLGESCHSGQPDEGRDAIKGLDELLNRIAALDDDLAVSTSHDVLAHEDVTVTEVVGGVAPNVVADRTKATIDWRFLPGTTDPEPFDNRIETALADLTVDGTTFDVTLKRTVFARAGETDSDHPVVAVVLEAVRDNDLNTEIVGFNAATDARFLIHDANIPTVHFGPGSITEDAHTVDESVAIDELVATVDVYRTVLDHLL